MKENKEPGGNIAYTYASHLSNVSVKTDSISLDKIYDAHKQPLLTTYTKTRT